LRSSLSDLLSRLPSVAYLLARRLLGCLMVLARREVSKDAELLVLRHENVVLRRQIVRVRYQPADRLWLAVLSRLIPGAGDAARLAPAAGPEQMGLRLSAASRTPGPRQPRSESS
jgi:hypothetical protein